MSSFHTKPIYPKQQNIGTVLWATVYKIHHTYFKPFHYFWNLFDHINLVFTIPQEYLPKQPIPFDNLNTWLFSHLLLYLYQPTLFERTQKNWESIRNIGKEWDFPELTYIAIYTSRTTTMFLYQQNSGMTMNDLET